VQRYSYPKFGRPEDVGPFVRITVSFHPSVTDLVSGADSGIAKRSVTVLNPLLDLRFQPCIAVNFARITDAQILEIVSSETIRILRCPLCLQDYYCIIPVSKNGY
jgi:hypothetical protein